LDPSPDCGKEDSLSEAEYVFERIVGMRKEEDGSFRYRVRWYGYTRSDDPWEPPHHLPEDAVHRYHRRVGLARTN
jgi:Chromo (CHRromatin Organisation MOdifier) domain